MNIFFRRHIVNKLAATQCQIALQQHNLLQVCSKLSLSNVNCKHNIEIITMYILVRKQFSKDFHFKKINFKICFWELLVMVIESWISDILDVTIIFGHHFKNQCSLELVLAVQQLSFHSLREKIASSKEVVWKLIMLEWMNIPNFCKQYMFGRALFYLIEMGVKPSIILKVNVI